MHSAIGKIFETDFELDFSIIISTIQFAYADVRRQLTYFFNDSRNNFQRIVNIPEDYLSSFVPELELEFCGEEGGGDIILSFKGLVTQYFRRLKVVQLLFC